MIPQEHDQAFAMLVVLLELVPQAKKKSKKEVPEAHRDKAARQSSPLSREVAYIPFPESFAPLPTQESFCTFMHSQDRTRQHNRKAPDRPQHMPVRLSAVLHGSLRAFRHT